MLLHYNIYVYIYIRYNKCGDESLTYIFERIMDSEKVFEFALVSMCLYRLKTFFQRIRIGSNLLYIFILIKYMLITVGLGGL